MASKCEILILRLLRFLRFEETQQGVSHSPEERGNPLSLRGVVRRHVGSSASAKRGEAPLKPATREGCIYLCIYVYVYVYVYAYIYNVYIYIYIHISF